MKRIRIPADIDQEDRILAGLTARQLVIIVVPAAACWAIYMATRSFIPPVVFIPGAVLVGGVVGALVVGQRDGLTMDRAVIAAVRYSRMSRRQVFSEEALTEAPSFVTRPSNAGAGNGLPSPLMFPVQSVDIDGVLDLGVDGSAALCVASSMNFALQTQSEQEMLSAAFGRFANSLTEPLQLVIRAEPVDLESAVEMLRSTAASLSFTQT